MTRENLIKELEVNGYMAEPIQTTKNGVVFEGIRIIDGKRISPTIYTKHLLEEAQKAGDNIGVVAQNIIDMYNETCNVKIDIDGILTDSYIYENIYIGLQRTSNEELIKRESKYIGIEDYLYITCTLEDNKGTLDGTIKCTHELLNRVGVDIDRAWKFALRNTKASATIKNIVSILKEYSYTDLNEFEGCIPMYVVTNHSGTKGASAIYNDEMLRGFAELYHVDKIVVIPSSIHEMIILPYEEGTDIEEFSEMVKMVNQNVVAEEEKLADRAYVIEV